MFVSFYYQSFPQIIEFCHQVWKNDLVGLLSIHVFLENKLSILAIIIEETYQQQNILYQFV